MERAKNAALVVCLFIVLLVIFSSYVRTNEAGTFFGALAGTPLLIHVFNRVAPIRRRPDPETSVNALVAHGEATPQSSERIVVLRMEGPNGRP